jgi:hypothetical protein
MDGQWETDKKRYGVKIDAMTDLRAKREAEEL